MAKQKARYKRRKYRNAKVRNTTCLDRHHIFYQRRKYGYGCLASLRLFSYCIVPIPKNTLHYEIHQSLSHVPVPKEVSTQDALYQLRMLKRYGAIKDEDPIELRLKVLIALFECCDQPTADALKKQLDIVNKFYTQPP